LQCIAAGTADVLISRDILFFIRKITENQISFDEHLHTDDVYVMIIIIIIIVTVIIITVTGVTKIQKAIQQYI
jgi:hypothetical protein